MGDANEEIASIEGIQTQVFFLRNNLNVYGPFERNGYELKAARFQDYLDGFEDDEFEDFVYSYKDKGFDGGIIFEINLQNQEIEDSIVLDNDRQEYLIGFNLLIERGKGLPIDFTPIDELHKWAQSQILAHSPELSKTVREVITISKVPNTIVNKLKWDKYLDHLSSLQDEDDYVRRTAEILTEKGFIGKVRDNQVLELERKLTDKEKENRQQRERIELLAQERDQFQNDLEEKSNIKESQIDIHSFPKTADLISTTEGCKKLEELLVLEIDRESKLKEFHKLEGKIEEKETRLEDLRKTEDGLEKQITNLENQFKDVANGHTAKLAEFKIYTDILNGIDIPIKSKSEEKQFITQNEINIIAPKETNAKDYILEIQRRLLRLGRPFHFNEIANLILTVNQSFLTIIAGAPGVGKTSLVERLAKTLGLNESFGYLEISCARGWSSSKDLIGFYNPLTQKYQQARTKLKDALINSQKHSNSPYLVLLDEANLSPLEHYCGKFGETDHLNSV